MRARPLLFSSYVITHRCVLVYKPNKNSFLFFMWDKTFFEKLFVIKKISHSHPRSQLIFKIPSSNPSDLKYKIPKIIIKVENGETMDSGDKKVGYKKLNIIFFNIYIYIYI